MGPAPILPVTIYIMFNFDGDCKGDGYGIGMCKHNLKARSQCAFFSDYDCYSFHRKKWVAQYSMEVFTPCDCDNITNSYAAHCEQK